MECYAKPYEGQEPYIFFSYAHEDAALVYSVIERLSIEGYRVWYDDGLHAGDNWPDVIAEHIFNASVFVAAISEKSSKSHNCNNERTYAINNNKPFLCILMEKFRMARGVQLQISSSRYLNYYDCEDNPEFFYSELLSSDILNICRTSERDSVSTETLSRWKKHCEEYHSSKQKPPKPPVPPLPPDPPKPPEPHPLVHAPEMLRAVLVRKKTGELFCMYSDRISLGRLDSDEIITDYRITDSEKIISRYHAEIYRKEEKTEDWGNETVIIGQPAKQYKIEVQFFLADRGSSNGTFHAGNRLQKDQSDAELLAFDEFVLATESFYFLSGQYLEHLSGMLKTGKMVFLTAADTGERKLLVGQELMLDRQHLWESGLLNSRAVSRNHAVIRMEDDSLYLLDAGSKNGTELNGKRLKAGEKQKLCDGDIITISKTDFVVTFVSLNPSSEVKKTLDQYLKSRNMQLEKEADDGGTIHIWKI